MSQTFARNSETMTVRLRTLSASVYLSGMAESNSSSDSERLGSLSVARTGQKSSRTFVWLRDLPKAMPRGRPWDELNREGRVKEIEFGKKFTERQMRDKIKENFPELAEVDFKR